MKKNNSENIFFTLLWVVLYLVFLFQLLPQSSVIEAFLFPALFVISAYPLTMHLSRNLLTKAIMSKKMKVFVLQFILYSVIVGVIFFVYLLLFSYIESIGILPISEYFNILNLPFYYLSVFFSAGVLINLCFCGLGFYSAHLKLEKNHLEAQLQSLQAQITPHFMFNVLNHVNVLIRIEPELASSLLVQYTNILRYQLYNGKKEFVSIKQEVDFLKDFIDIEKVRWKNNLEVNCSWDIVDDNTTLSPLLLITFVENAFKHVSRSKTEKGYVNIDLKQKKGELTLFVENSKYADIPTTENKDVSGIGLENIKKRLEILYPNKYDLRISKTDAVYSTSLSIKL